MSKKIENGFEKRNRERYEEFKKDVMLETFKSPTGLVFSMRYRHPPTGIMLSVEAPYTAKKREECLQWLFERVKNANK